MKQLAVVDRLLFPAIGTFAESHVWCRVFPFASNFTPNVTHKHWAHHIMAGDAVGGL